MGTASMFTVVGGKAGRIDTGQADQVRGLRLWQS
jgi:hypothetical protein